MSHFFLLLFLLLSGRIYLLDFIRGWRGITHHEALSYAKSISLMSDLPSAVTRRGGEEFPLCSHKVGRRPAAIQSGPHSRALPDKATAAALGWLELTVQGGSTLSCQRSLARAPMPVSRCGTGQTLNDCGLNE